MKTSAAVITTLLFGQLAALVVQNTLTASPDHRAQDQDHPYHIHPPLAPLPSTLDPAQFKDNRSAFVAYTLAGRIRELLYQEPCYCPCHKEMQHQSLLDCFAGNHGRSCHLCKQEVIYCYEQSKLGKNPKMIREGLMDHRWNTIDVAKYAEDFLSEPR
jgi:hypothetical protein